MSKGKHGNKEAKKPKRDKPLLPAQPQPSADPAERAALRSPERPTRR